MILGKTCFTFNVMPFLTEYIRAKFTSHVILVESLLLQKSASLRSFTPSRIHHLGTVVQAILGLGDLPQSPHLGCVPSGGRVSLCSRTSDRGINSHPVKGRLQQRTTIHAISQPFAGQCPASAVVPAAHSLFLQVSKEKSPLVYLSQQMRIYFQNRFHSEQRGGLKNTNKMQQCTLGDFMKQSFFCF